MIQLEYFDGKTWIPTGRPFLTEKIAWISLGRDNKNYRTVDDETGRVLTDASVKNKEEDHPPSPGPSSHPFYFK